MKIATKAIDTASAVVTFHFANGKKLACPIGDLDGEMRDRYALHGVAQKIGDSYASAGENGWTVDQCFDIASETWTATVNGEWAVRGRVSGVVDAMASVYDRTYEEALEVWNTLDAKAKRQVAKDPAILKYLAEQELARAGAAKPAIDVSKLFK